VTMAPADIVVLSRLLDEAAAVDPAERERWFAALPPDHEHLRDKLQAMLRRTAAASDALPPL
jgi:hypothetical protein